MKTRFDMILILLFLIGLKSSVFAKTSALLIGIDEYPGLTKNRWLGNVSRNGVKLMKMLLTERFNVTDIDILLNKDATRDEIIDKIKSYEGKLNSSDVLLIYYTGNGTTVLSKNRDEWLDGAIVCYNFGFAPNELNGQRVNSKNIIIDDEIGKMIDKIKTNNGPTIVFIADTCHSGTMTRGGTDKNQVDTSDLLKMGIPKIRWPWEDRAESRNSFLISASKPSSDVMIPACLDTQEANAKKILLDGYVGLLTYNLVSALSESNRDLAYYTLEKILNAKIKDQVAHQTPQVLGNVSSMFLDSRVYVKYATRGIGNIDDDRRTKVFIDGFDGEDTSAIESAFDKAGPFATIVDEMDKIGKDTLIFKTRQAKTMQQVEP